MQNGENWLHLGSLNVGHLQRIFIKTVFQVGVISSNLVSCCLPNFADVGGGKEVKSIFFTGSMEK
jgi:hypothetical protein